MGKRGQVFILAAILIAVILFSLSVIKNKFEQREIKGDFETLSENFQIESSRLINSVITSGADANEVQESFKSFSIMFTSYAKGKNPEYGLIYVLSFGDKMQVTNFLDRGIIIQGCNPDTSEPYSIYLNGSFEKVPAEVNFEEFNIGTSITWSEINSSCEDLPAFPSSPNENKTISDRFCVFLPQPAIGTKTEFSVIINGVSYYLCVEKGVPELMQVSTMKQGEQAKVKGTGKCINQDFCSTLSQTSCEECGKDTCFWWTFGTGGLCLSRYAYPGRLSGECIPDVELCSDDSTIYLYDTCKKEIEKKQTCSVGEVCHDSTDLPGLTTQCCEKHSYQKCSGNDVYWFSSPCNIIEDPYDECQDDEVCHEDVDSVDAKCCVKEDHLECFENNVYWYSNCQTTSGDYTRESLKLTCSANTLCRDSGLPPEITEDAVCCIKDYEQKCYDDDIYNFDGCGIMGSLVENCKGNNKVCRDASYEVSPTECCKLNYEKKCYDNDVYWYNDCGTREEKFKECEDKGCEDGQCKTV